MTIKTDLERLEKQAKLIVGMDESDRYAHLTDNELDCAIRCLLEGKPIPPEISLTKQSPLWLMNKMPTSTQESRMSDAELDERIAELRQKYCY